MRKHSFGWTPKRTERADFAIEKELFTPVCQKILRELEWDIVYTDDTTVEAKAKTNKQWSEKITIEWHLSKLLITSVSLTNQMWDEGKNFKRIEQFRIGMDEFLKELSSAQKKELLEEVKNEKAEWEKYRIPDTLPEPPSIPKINCGFFFFMVLTCSVILGSIYGIGKSIMHIIILYEVLIALGLAFGLGLFLKRRRFNVFRGMNIHMTIGAISIVLVSELTLYFLFSKAQYYGYFHIRLFQITS